MPRLSPSTLSAWTLVIVVTLLKLTIAAHFPLVEDEIYYAMWARHLAWGYFDHPPMVAWWIWLGQFFFSGSLALRAVGIFASAFAALAVWDLTSLLWPKYPMRQWIVFTIYNLSFIGLAGGIFATPDASLMVFWTLALWTSVRALVLRPTWWWLTGLFLAGAILSKYVAGILALVCLLMGLAQPRSRTALFGGVILCVLVLLPHIFWLNQHDWITVKFLAKRGLVSDRSTTYGNVKQFPIYAMTAPQGTPEFEAGEIFTRDEKPHVPRPWWQRTLKNLGDLASGVALIWGAFALLIVRTRWRRERSPSMSRPAQRLLYLAAVVPLVLFGTVALWSKIEINWLVVYGLSAIFLLPLPARPDRWLWLAAAANIALFCVVGFLGHNVRGISRLQKETFGYKELAQHLHQICEPWCLTATYQLTSMLNFYDHDSYYVQAPGITRSSQFALDPQQQHFLQASWPDLKLIGPNAIPPLFPGYSIEKHHQLAACADGSIKSFAHPDDENCKVQRTWYFSTYRRVSR